jgi:hypothetical protein
MGPTTEEIKPLRAHFVHGDEHTFDSERAQRENEWSDEERLYVEKKLQDPYNGYVGKLDGRGIWVVEDGHKAEIPVKAGAICRAVREFDGEPCDNFAVEGGLYCEDHILAAVAPPIETTGPAVT